MVVKLHHRRKYKIQTLVPFSRSKGTYYVQRFSPASYAKDHLYDLIVSGCFLNVDYQNKTISVLSMNNRVCRGDLRHISEYCSIEQTPNVDNESIQSFGSDAMVCFYTNVKLGRLYKIIRR